MKKLCWILLPLLTVGAFAQTVTNTYHSISLEECIKLALLHNRDLQIQRYEPEIARFNLRAAYGYYDPNWSLQTRRSAVSSAGAFDPEDLSGFRTYEAVSHTVNSSIRGQLPSGLSYTLTTDYAKSFGIRAGDEFDSFNSAVGISAQQPLLKNFWIDSGRMAIRINKKNLKITELGVDYLIMQVIMQVQQAYYDLLYAHEFVRVQEQLLDLKQEFYGQTKRKVEVGALAPLQEKLAESQVAAVQADLISARNNVALTANRLKGLLGDDFVSSVAVTLTPSDRLIVLPEQFDLQQSWRNGISKRPDLLQMKIDVEKFEIQEKYWFNQKLPAFDIVAGYSRSGASSSYLLYPPAVPPPSRYVPPSFASTLDQIRSGSSPSDFFGAVFSMPLTRTRERNSLLATKQAKSQAILKVSRQEEVILKQIDDAIKSAKTYLESVTATRKAVEYAKDALEAEKKTFEAGKSTPYTVLQLQSDLATAMSNEIQSKANYNKALSTLFFSDGTLLDRSRIAVDVK
ncbi:MAG: TolC family protein [Verrucomicrobia bacterium]|nr:TolC family protein [Verrucomicrobiota bacterium]